MSADHSDRHSREDHRNEHRLRAVPIRRPKLVEGDCSQVEYEVDVYLGRVRSEVLRLLAEHPHLEGESPDRLFCRYISPETAPSFESVLRRSAFALLHLRAVDRAEMADFSSGGDAA